MGKYMVRQKNPKPPPSDVALCGVRTRAKTLALLNNNKTPDNNNNHSYLQLRSRRLHKPPRGTDENKNKRRRRGRKRNYLNAPVDGEKKKNKSCCDLGENGIENDVVVAEEEEGCFGENFGDCEARERSTRETTPISLVRDPEIIRTPGSSTRPTAQTRPIYGPIIPCRDT